MLKGFEASRSPATPQGSTRTYCRPLLRRTTTEIFTVSSDFADAACPRRAPSPRQPLALRRAPSPRRCPRCSPPTCREDVVPTALYFQVSSLSKEFYFFSRDRFSFRVPELVGEHKQKKVESHFYIAFFVFLTFFGPTFVIFCQYYFVSGPCILCTRQEFIKKVPETFRG